MMLDDNPSQPVARTWNEEWQALQKTRRNTDSVEFWGSKARAASAEDFNSAYIQAFLDKLAIRDNEIALDMGCGNGVLSILLGRQGHKVLACDFSEQMLKVVKEGLQTAKVNTVTPKLLSWDDDWEQKGVYANSVDVAFASRSVITENLEEALLKLNKVARRRVCVTLFAGGSPRIDKRAVEAIGLSPDQGRDHEFAIGILEENGIEPELCLIESNKSTLYASEGEAITVYCRMIDDLLKDSAASAKEVYYKRMQAWLHEHLVQSSADDAPEGFRLDEPRKNTWAFISWNKLQ